MPTAAFVLSIISGIFVIIGTFSTYFLGIPINLFSFGIVAFIAISGIVFGILILAFAFLLTMHPDQHVLYGALIIVFSIISLFSALGGFFIGFLLGLIGGILAIAWRPVPMPPPKQSQSPPGNGQQ